MKQWCHSNNILYLMAVSIAQIVLTHVYSFDPHNNHTELAVQRHYSHFTKEETTPCQ